jgi:hypothetical protein
MRIRLVTLLVPVLGLSWLNAGCQETAEPPSSHSSSELDSLVSVHWSGTRHVAADTNSASLLQIASLPETQQLREQTLNKLALAPWTLKRVTPDTNASVLLKPVLEDVLNHECLFKLVADGKGQLAWFLASRLERPESQLWETNLAAALGTLTGKGPSPMGEGRDGWLSAAGSGHVGPPENADDQRTAARLFFTRSGPWTLLGSAKDPATFDAISEDLLSHSAEFIPASNLWLKATVALDRLASLSVIPTNQFATYPALEMKVGGDRGQLRTEATLAFPTPLNLNLTPWNVPTHLVQPLLASFSVIRSLDQLLPQLASWRNLEVGQVPNQIFIWSYAGQPMFTYFAAQVPDPSDLVAQVSQRLLRNGQSWKDDKLLIGFKRSTEHDGVEWQGLPYLYPFLRSIETNGSDHVLGGAFSYTPPSEPIKPEFYEEALSPTNLVFYGWEHTGQRLGHWLFIGQFIRFVSGKAQLPNESAAVRWIQAARTNLADSVTRIHQDSPNQLTLTRSSSVGFTAFELHVLMDWLESPEFPRGLHTVTAPPSSAE